MIKLFVSQKCTHASYSPTEKKNSVSNPQMYDSVTSKPLFDEKMHASMNSEFD